MATLRFETIGDLGHPDLKPYVTLRRRKDLARQQVFVAEGEKVVRRLLESAYPVESLLITEDWLTRIESLLERRAQTIRVFIATRPQIEQITGFTCYQGIKAVGSILRRPTLEEVLGQTARPHLFVALDGISNAENLGVIVRNCAALGTQAILVGETSASPFLTRAIRTSMGAIFSLPAVETDSLVQSLAQLRHRGIRCWGADPLAECRTLAGVPLTEDCCIVLGNEGYGLSEAVRAACDRTVAIPMARGVDSLNVSSAAAVFLYEVARQRGTLNP